MSQSLQLSQLRPLMTRAEIEAVLGREQANRALDMLSNPQRETGVSVNFSHRDEVIDSVSYFVNFPRDVPVSGACIGMTADELRRALPEVRLADGATGMPDAHGFVRYRAEPASLNATLSIAIKNGEVAAITLSRLDMGETQARRDREDAERMPNVIASVRAPIAGNRSPIPTRCCWIGAGTIGTGETTPHPHVPTSPAG